MEVGCFGLLVFLQIFQHEKRICCFLSWHGAKLHLIYIILFSFQLLKFIMRSVILCTKSNLQYPEAPTLLEYLPLIWCFIRSIIIVIQSSHVDATISNINPDGPTVFCLHIANLFSSHDLVFKVWYTTDHIWLRQTILIPSKLAFKTFSWQLSWAIFLSPWLTANTPSSFLMQCSPI